MLGEIWFCLVAIMIVMYVVLDGYDLGAGIISPLVAKTPAERRQVLSTIGPVWDGNEVWLLAAGGTLYFAFPALYASSFSGFYLPLMIVLWLLILRAVSIEFHHQINHPTWTPVWDRGFFLSSALLAIFFGAALGNVVRGVPLDESGYFFSALWTNFRVGAETGILDWYTIPVGFAAFAALMMHGSLWVALKTEGEVNRRAWALAPNIWWAVVALTLLITALTFAVQPQVLANLAAHPWGYIFPALALGGLAAVRWYHAAGNELRAFLASVSYLLGMLTSAVFGVFPYVLPARNSAYSLTIETAKAPDYGLKIGLIWWPIGMALVAAYFIYVNRHFAGKVKSGDQIYGESAH
jgi:cytochrome bd ubiquinol oxidase subunit II